MGIQSYGSSFSRNFLHRMTFGPLSLSRSLPKEVFCLDIFTGDSHLSTSQGQKLVWLCVRMGMLLLLSLTSLLSLLSLLLLLLLLLLSLSPALDVTAGAKSQFSYTPLKAALCAAIELQIDRREEEGGEVETGIQGEGRKREMRLNGDKTRRVRTP